MSRAPRKQTLVVDATTIISLAIVDKFDLLHKLYAKVFVPKAVYEEILAGGESNPGFKEVQAAKWIKVEQISDERAKGFLLLELNEGESESIILAEEKGVDLVVLDEKLAREVAKLRGLKITGTLGILIKAKKIGLVKEIKPLVEALIENGIWISEDVYKSVLQEAGEM
jgi:predicted nucleic acid-binding protein